MHAFVGMLRIESGVDALYLELNESTIYTSTISGGWGRETAFGAGGLGRSGAPKQIIEVDPALWQWGGHVTYRILVGAPFHIIVGAPSRLL